MEKISIIIPVYNGEKFIQEAIESALNQDYENKEVIVVDDGSTDDTRALILQYWGKITMVLQSNQGTANALNTGIRNSVGEWIKWLSADDVLYPNALTETMKQVDDKNCIYYTSYDYIGDHGGEFIEPERDINDLWSFFYGNGSTSLIHKSVFNKCGVFDDSLKHSEDYEFWLRATMVYGVKLKLIPIKTIKYRIHSGQLTNKAGGSNDVMIKNKIRGLMNG